MSYNKTRGPILAAFARGGIKPGMEEDSMVAAYVDGGLNWFGPLPFRPNDVAGIVGACTVYGQEFRRSTFPNTVAGSEKTLALAYKANITPWFSVQADVQFLFDPAVSPKSGTRETATVLGMRAQVTF